MQELIQELIDIHEQLKVFERQIKDANAWVLLDTIQKSAEKVGQSWSKSWLGYHANIYYQDLQKPPPGAHFSSEWGWRNDTRGDWREHDFDYVKEQIFQRASGPNIEPVEKLTSNGQKLFDDKRHQINSILEAVKLRHTDNFITSLFDQVQNEVATASNYISVMAPKSFVSRYSLAMSQGIWISPHFKVLSEVFYMKSVIKACESLSDIAQKTVQHLKRVKPEKMSVGKTGTKVFIGHGRSLVWRDLKDLIQDRLKLQWDEFNRVPIAGITNTARLAEMLDEAAIAFLIMTAEDEQASGKIHARINVIHEAGLFQGRLGFNKAILLVEEGCEEFSNVNGLGQIRFPKGDIKAVSEEIRRVLEREGIIES